MKSEAVKDELLITYLLGGLSGEEAERIEKTYFADGEIFERLLVIEQELIDAYVSGELSETDRKRFENHFLPLGDRRERVEFALEWKDYVAASSATKLNGETAPQRSWRDFFSLKNPWMLVPVAASILLVLVAGWLMIQTIRLNDQLDHIRAQRETQSRKEQELEQQVAEERRRNEQLLQELESERNRREPENQTPPPTAPSQSPIVSFILSLGVTRGEGDDGRLVIPSGAKQVRLELRFKVGDYPSYRASLESELGRQLWSRSGLSSLPRGDGKRVVLTVPASAFDDGDYILILSGVTPTGEAENVGEYSFRIVKK